MIYTLLLAIILLIILLVYSKNKQNNLHKQLKQSTNNCETIFNSSLEAIILWDSAKTIIKANQRFSNLSQYTPEELIGMHIFDFFDPEEYDNFLLENLKDSSKEYNLNLMKKDGSSILLLIKQNTLIYNNQKVNAWFCLNLSTIKQKELELEKLNLELEQKVQNAVQANREKDQSIIEQSRLAQLGEMLSMIAHQWRQPLTAISATCNNIILQTMNNKPIENKYLQDELSLVTNYTQYLSDTIDDFRNFFKTNKHKETTTTDKIINETLKIVSSTIENQNITLNLNLHCDKEIETYSGEVKQVILNIIKNAQDAIVQNNIQDPQITIETHCDGNGMVKILIYDNAKGIPFTILDKIFEPYFSTKQELDGTGLGLYMSKIIIEKNCGGKLSATNKDDGAIFTIQLPINNN